MALKVYNVLTRTKQDFVPLNPGVVNMYACGITVSGDAHIGHAYQSVVFDVITRYLRYLGYDVKYVRNYTDVDDKIIANAARAGMDPIEFAEKYMAQTDIEMDALGNAQPTIMARATKCIDDIINLIRVEKIEEKIKDYLEKLKMKYELIVKPEIEKLSDDKLKKSAEIVARFEILLL